MVPFLADEGICNEHKKLMCDDEMALGVEFYAGCF